MSTVARLAGADIIDGRYHRIEILRICNEASRQTIGGSGFGTKT